MEKKRYKMYKKGKSWLIAPIVFFGIVSLGCFAQNNEVFADEVIQVDQINNNDTNDSEKIKTDNFSRDNMSSENESNLPEQESNTNNEVETENADNVNNNDSLKNDEQSEENIKDTNKDNQEQPQNTDSENTISDKQEESESSETEQGSIKDTQSSNDTNNENNQQSEKEEIVDSKKDKEVETKEENNLAEQNDKKLTNKNNFNDKNKANNAEVVKSPIVSKQVTSLSKAGNTQVIIPIYRVYNPNSGEHLHTINSNEKDFLVKKGWRYEGISMRVTNSGQNLLRIYNPNSGEHHYTLNTNEINMLKRAGWRYEGIAWQTPSSGLPMYRVFNPNSRGAGSHHYTLLKSERDSLLRQGWRNEGISWYTVSGASPIQLNYLGINSQYIINELSKHSSDRYYLGTPYKGLSSNNATQFMNPGTSMNCTGFVAKVIQNAGGNLNKITSVSNNWGGVANAYNWRNALNNNVVSYTFNTVADLLKSGKAKKGDILYFEPNYNVANYDCHIGFFWGNSSSENKIWHSVPAVNKISTIYAPSGFSKIIVYSM